jgi:hypothetical protein
VPTETRICRGKSASAQVGFFANYPTERKQCVKWYISLELDTVWKRNVGVRQITFVLLP